MSISKKIVQFLGLAASLLLVVITIQYFYGKRSSQLLASERVADSVVHEISSLLFLVDEFQDRKNVRLFMVWQRQFEHLTESLSKHPELYNQIVDDLNLIHKLINELYEEQSEAPLTLLSEEQREKRIRKEQFINDRNDIAIRSILSKTVRYSQKVSLRQERTLRFSQYVQIGLILILITLFFGVVLTFLNQLSQSFKLLSQKINLSHPPISETAISETNGRFPFREFNDIQDNFHKLLGSIHHVNRQLEENRVALDMAVDRERASIASELHDNITQLLGMAKMHLNNIGLEESAIRGNHRFQKSQELLGQVTEDIRDLTHRIMPASIVDFGIVLSVQELLSDVEDTCDLKTVLTYNEDIRLSEEKELNVYRIVQEVVANTVKHARASILQVNLHFKKSELTVRVADDGIGFCSTEKPYGIGLRTMYNRAERIQAKLDLFSNENGTVTTLRVPMN